MRGFVAISGDSFGVRKHSRFHVAGVDLAMRLPSCDVERTHGGEPVTSREITDIRRELRLREGTPGGFRRPWGDMYLRAKTSRHAPSRSRR